MEQTKIIATLSSPNSLSGLATKVVDTSLFQRLVISAIVGSAVLIGLETSPEIMDRWGTTLKTIDKILVLLFAVEIALKLTSHGRTFWQFFRELRNDDHSESLYRGGREQYE